MRLYHTSCSTLTLQQAIRWSWQSASSSIELIWHLTITQTSSHIDQYHCAYLLVHMSALALGMILYRHRCVNTSCDPPNIATAPRQFPCFCRPTAFLHTLCTATYISHRGICLPERSSLSSSALAARICMCIATTLSVVMFATRHARCSCLAPLLLLAAVCDLSGLRAPVCNPHSREESCLQHSS